MARIKKFEVTVMNGSKVMINDNHINRIIVSGSWNFDTTTDTLTFEYEGYDMVVSPEMVTVQQKGKKAVRGTTSAKNSRGRNIYLKHGSIKINVSRLWLLCKELVNHNITIENMDEYVLNHKDNKGDEEAWIEGTEGLEVGNYELVKQQLNKIHGDIWYTLRDWGYEAKFSALDTVFITIVNLSDTKEQFLEIMKAKELNLSDYGIREVF